MRDYGKFEKGEREVKSEVRDHGQKSVQNDKKNTKWFIHIRIL